MRILVAAVLLIQLLDISNAEPLPALGGDGLFGKIYHFSKAVGSRRSTFSATRFVRSLREEDATSLEEECMRHGGFGSFDEAESRIDITLTVLFSELDSEEADDEMDEADRARNNARLVGNMCAKNETVIKFISEVTEATKTCLDAVGKESIENLKLMTTNVIGFLCEDDGAKLTSFLTTGGPECVEEKEEDLTICLGIIDDESSEENSENVNEVALNSDSSFVMGEEECALVSELQKCVKRELETCEKPGHGHFLANLIQWAVEPICGPLNMPQLIPAAGNTL